MQWGCKFSTSQQLPCWRPNMADFPASGNQVRGWKVSHLYRICPAAIKPHFPASQPCSMIGRLPPRGMEYDGISMGFLWDFYGTSMGLRAEDSHCMVPKKTQKCKSPVKNRGFLGVVWNIFWLVVWLPFFLFSHILGISNHPNWRSYFSEGWPNHQPVLLGLLGPVRSCSKSFMRYHQDDPCRPHQFGLGFPSQGSTGEWPVMGRSGRVTIKDWESYS